MNRAETWEALRRLGRVDVLVIGGGIAGAGVALEAARCGAKVALVEARDFASGTSSRSSKLVHGGLRYLAQGQFGTTRASVRARDALVRDAPGLVEPLRFLVPVRRGDRIGRRGLGAALALFDAFAGRRSRAWHGPVDALARVPGLAPLDLVGAWSYADAQTDDARLVLRVLAEARRRGAITLNHVAARDLVRREGRVVGAHLVEAETGAEVEIEAACVVNAAGAWADGLRARLGRAPLLRPLRGSHLLVPAWRLPVPQPLGFAHPADRRPVFAVPWEGATLVGTTDVDHREDLAVEPAITADESAYLLEAVAATWPMLGIAATDVRATWAGVRPVVSSGRGVRPSKEAREHLLVEEEGLVTVTAGKLTTFRDVAFEALRLASRHVPSLHAANPGAPLLASPDGDVQQALAHVPGPWRRRWIARFGHAAARLGAAVAPGAEPEAVAGTGIAWAELHHALAHEAVLHLDDLLLRRTRAGLLLPEGGEALLPRLESTVRAALGWDAARWTHEIARYRDTVARCYAPPRMSTTPHPVR
jgi:glycerol-3-phosphate dehydrogenase